MMTNGFRTAAIVALLGACSEDPTALPLGGLDILGEWNYASAPRCAEPPCLNAGLHVTIVIESLDAMQFRGHVAWWFSGDVGTPPAAFGPVTGTVDSDGAVTMRIPFTALAASPITLTGTVTGDVLTVHESLRGPDPGPFLRGESFERNPR